MFELLRISRSFNLGVALFSYCSTEHCQPLAYCVIEYLPILNGDIVLTSAEIKTSYKQDPIVFKLAKGHLPLQDFG